MFHQLIFFFQCSDYCIPFWKAYFKRNIDILRYVQRAQKYVTDFRIEGTRNIFPSEEEIEGRHDRSIQASEGLSGRTGKRILIPKFREHLKVVGR